METFVGERGTDGRCRVYVEDRCDTGAPRRRHRKNTKSHSPTGFEWGVAMTTEREEFVDALRQRAFFAEREDGLNEIVTDSTAPAAAGTHRSDGRARP